MYAAIDLEEPSILGLEPQGKVLSYPAGLASDSILDDSQCHSADAGP